MAAKPAPVVRLVLVLDRARLGLAPLAREDGLVLLARAVVPGGQETRAQLALLLNEGHHWVRLGRVSSVYVFCPKSTQNTTETSQKAF